MSRLLTAALLVIGLAGLPVAAPLANPNLYVGGGLGYYRIKDASFPANGSNEDFRDDRVAWRVFGGARMGTIFGVEGGYQDFGRSRDGAARAEIDGWNLGLTAQVPLIPLITPYAKLGQLFWDRETRVGDVRTSSRSSSNMYYGLGVRFSLLPGVGLRLDYDRYKVDDANVDLATINLQIGF